MTAGTFSADVLRLEIPEPDKNDLSVIDGPRIFKTTTPGLTLKSDMVLNYLRVTVAEMDDTHICKRSSIHIDNTDALEIGFTILFSSTYSILKYAILLQMILSNINRGESIPSHICLLCLLYLLHLSRLLRLLAQ